MTHKQISLTYFTSVIFFLLIKLDSLIHYSFILRHCLSSSWSQNNLEFTKKKKKKQKQKNAFEFDSVVSTQLDSSQCVVSFLLFSWPELRKRWIGWSHWWCLHCFQLQLPSDYSRTLWYALHQRLVMATLFFICFNSSAFCPSWCISPYGLLWVGRELNSEGYRWISMATISLSSFMFFVVVD